MTTELVQQQQQLGPFCQSCGMPLRTPDDFGTMENGLRQNGYCYHCFANGAFLQPDMSMEQMIELSVGPWAQAEGRPEAEVRVEAQRFFPLLKRWHKQTA